jgi:hypothetical protein
VSAAYVLEPSRKISGAALMGVQNRTLAPVGRR